MKKLAYKLVFLSLGLISLHVTAAVKVVECEDEEGNRTFQKACPPGSTAVNEKRLATGTASEIQTGTTNKGNISAILYTIPECSACDDVREFLQGRDIPITEKNVNDDVELQQELTEIAGVLKVPATVIGESVIKGYDRSQLMSALEAAGYVNENKKSESESESGSQDSE